MSKIGRECGKLEEKYDEQLIHKNPLKNIIHSEHNAQSTDSNSIMSDSVIGESINSCYDSIKDSNYNSNNGVLVDKALIQDDGDDIENQSPQNTSEMYKDKSTNIKKKPILNNNPQSINKADEIDNEDTSVIKIKQNSNKINENDLNSEDSGSVADLNECDANLDLVDQEKAEHAKEEIAFLRSDAEEREARYNQLLVLLNRSHVYVSIIKKRMEEESKKACEKEAKLLKATKKTECTSSHNTRSKTNPKRKANEMELYRSAGKRRKLSDIFSSRRQSKETSSDETQSPVTNNREIETVDVAPESESAQDGLLLLTNGTLRSYQREGYKWMATLFENGMNGILADEMGLGKTVQVIALISYLIQRRVEGPFLIVAPLSTLPNWKREFLRFAPAIPVMLYHGTKEERDQMRHNMLNTVKLRMPEGKDSHQSHTRHYSPGEEVKLKSVIITSYEIILKDWRELRRHTYKALVVDEGHRLKNSNCLLTRCLRMFHTDLRIILTGTPLQNNLAELWSLLNFLLPEIFSSLETFEAWFDPNALLDSDGQERLIKQEQEKAVISVLHDILTPFLLRRLKCDVDLAVPPKREVIVYATMTPRQQELYKNAAEETLELMMGRKRSLKLDFDVNNILDGERSKRRHSVAKYEEPPDEDEEWFTESEHYSQEGDEEQACESSTETSPCTRIITLNVRNRLMLFKRILNHPYLIEYPLDKDGEYLLSEDIISLSGKMRVLDKLLTQLKKEGRKVLVFSQMSQILDIIQDYLNYKGWRYSRLDGSFQLQSRLEQIEWFHDDSSIFVFLLTARAGGLGLNLVAADTVIIFDSDWNPQVDLQAQDRCHRIGQKNPVLVFRLVTKHTIDQKIIDRATSKRQLEKLIISQKKFKSSIASTNDEVAQNKNKMQGLTRQELLEMLQKKDFENEYEDDGLSDDMVKQLLDRSDLQARWEMSKDKDATAKSTKLNEASTKSSQENLSKVCRVLNDEQGNLLGSFLTE